MDKNVFYSESIYKNNDSQININEDVENHKEILNKNNGEINSLQLELTNKNKKINELNEIIMQKNNELSKFNEQLNNLKTASINSNFKDFLPGEEIISVMFKSDDHKIEYSLPCKNTTTFVKIEEKLYEEYPEYKETNNYFLVNGNRVKRFKTIKENQITNGKSILFIKGE